MTEKYDAGHYLHQENEAATTASDLYGLHGSMIQYTGAGQDSLTQQQLLVNLQIPNGALTDRPQARKKTPERHDQFVQSLYEKQKKTEARLSDMRRK